MNYKDLFKDSMSLLLEPEVKELIEWCEFWEQRALLAETIIDNSPCDPDITFSQKDAWGKYVRFMENNYPKFMSKIIVSFPAKCTQWENESYCDEKGKCLKCVNK